MPAARADDPLRTSDVCLNRARVRMHVGNVAFTDDDERRYLDAIELRERK
jgi:hypothetical protein